MASDVCDQELTVLDTVIVPDISDVDGSISLALNVCWTIQNAPDDARVIWRSPDHIPLLSHCIVVHGAVSESLLCVSLLALQELVSEFSLALENERLIQCISCLSRASTYASTKYSSRDVAILCANAANSVADCLCSRDPSLSEKASKARTRLKCAPVILCELCDGLTSLVAKHRDPYIQTTVLRSLTVFSKEFGVTVAKPETIELAARVLSEPGVSDERLILAAIEALCQWWPPLKAPGAQRVLDISGSTIEHYMKSKPDRDTQASPRLIVSACTRLYCSAVVLSRGSEAELYRAYGLWDLMTRMSGATEYKETIYWIMIACISAANFSTIPVMNKEQFSRLVSSAVVSRHPETVALCVELLAVVASKEVVGDSNVVFDFSEALAELMSDPSRLVAAVALLQSSEYFESLLFFLCSWPNSQISFEDPVVKAFQTSLRAAVKFSPELVCECLAYSLSPQGNRTLYSIVFLLPAVEFCEVLQALASCGRADACSHSLLVLLYLWMMSNKPTHQMVIAILVKVGFQLAEKICGTPACSTSYQLGLMCAHILSAIPALASTAGACELASRLATWVGDNTDFSDLFLSITEGSVESKFDGYIPPGSLCPEMSAKLDVFELSLARRATNSTVATLATVKPVYAVAAARKGTSPTRAMPPKLPQVKADPSGRSTNPQDENRTISDSQPTTGDSQSGWTTWISGAVTGASDSKPNEQTGQSATTRSGGGWFDAVLDAAEALVPDDGTNETQTADASLSKPDDPIDADALLKELNSSGPGENLESLEKELHTSTADNTETMASTGMSSRQFKKPARRSVEAPQPAQNATQDSQSDAAMPDAAVPKATSEMKPVSKATTKSSEKPASASAPAPKLIQASAKIAQAPAKPMAQKPKSSTPAPAPVAEQVAGSENEPQEEAASQPASPAKRSKPKKVNTDGKAEKEKPDSSSTEPTMWEWISGEAAEKERLQKKAAKKEAKRLAEEQKAAAAAAEAAAKAAAEKAAAEEREKLKRAQVEKILAYQRAKKEAEEKNKKKGWFGR